MAKRLSQDGKLVMIWVVVVVVLVLLGKLITYGIVTTNRYFDYVTSEEYFMQQSYKQGGSFEVECELDFEPGTLFEAGFEEVPNYIERCEYDDKEGWWTEGLVLAESCRFVRDPRNRTHTELRPKRLLLKGLDYTKCTIKGVVNHE